MTCHLSEEEDVFLEAGVLLAETGHQFLLLLHQSVVEEIPPVQPSPEPYTNRHTDRQTERDRQTDREGITSVCVLETVRNEKLEMCGTVSIRLFVCCSLT